jgi:lysophospholipase L1-like esterase
MRKSSLILPLLWGAACGGGSPTSPPPPEPTYSVSGLVYYDENANGRLDPGEAVRLPGVELVAGSASGRSTAGGQVTVAGVRAGAQTVAIRTESLPAFWVPGEPMTLQVPQAGGPLEFPVRLPIGDNEPNVYLAFGDSLTQGEGSSDHAGYRTRLRDLLGAHLGAAFLAVHARPGTFSLDGAARIPGRLTSFRPAYTLILYGTNDWNDQACQNAAPAGCFTIDSLRTILDEVKAARSLPVLATLPPVNPALAPEGRNRWNDEMNGLIKSLAQAEGALLADLNAEFKAKGDLPPLFSDGIHPNDAGYQVMAEGWFKAITRARAAAASGARRP